MIYQQALPEPWKSITDEHANAEITRIRKKLGKELVVLAHHYQRPEIVYQSDFRGDSLKLSQYAAEQTDARYVVFCGVHFMAESADILKRGNQIVILPDLEAGCDMADMAPADSVRESWDEIVKLLGHDSIMPVTYVNSSAALKAFVGEKGGVVCTSSNAENILRWALSQKKCAFFFPDQHLGRYAGRQLGIPLSKMPVWKINENTGGITEEVLREAQVILWDGCCPVHQMFQPKHIENILSKDPQFRIIAHPECSLEVLDKAELVGSTEFIVKCIVESKPGTKWAVGTEMHLVTRIAMENPDKSIVGLNPFPCLCSTMNRIDLAHLAWALACIEKGEPQNIITVPEPTKTLAHATLTRMLSLS